MTLPHDGTISVAQLAAAHEAWLPAYMAGAAARVVLAMAIVPLRRMVGTSGD